MVSRSNSAGAPQGDLAVTTSASPTNPQVNRAGVTFAPIDPAATEHQQWTATGRRTVTFAEAPHANAAAFSPINALNSNSEPDRQTHPANIGRAMRPIGSPTESLKPLRAYRHGPLFTTDVDIAVHGGRYVELGNIPEEAHTNGFLDYIITSTGIRTQLQGYAVAEAFCGAVKAYFFFDDLRAAKNSEAIFARNFYRSTFRYISLDEYFAVDPGHFRAQLHAEFDGQVQFVAKHMGPPQDFSLQLLYNVTRIHALTYGDIRTFALQEPCDVSLPRFRVEYYSITHADLACQPGDFKERLELDHDILASCQEFCIRDLQGPRLHRRAVFIPQQQPRRDVHHQNPNGRHGHGHGNSGGRSNGAVAHRGAHYQYNQQSHRGEAPEYRNRASRTNGQHFVSTGIHDHVDHAVIRASGPENIYKQPQTITIDSHGHTNDVRTTVMIRNIPNSVEATDLNDWLDETSKGMYDFSYLRIDFENNTNVGYAFVNFVSSQAVSHFCLCREKKPWDFFPTAKTCEVSYATVQGQDCLVEKFRNSSVMREWKGYRPKLWFSIDTPDRPDDKNVGDEAPFPASNNQSKLQRSLDNARNIGLYPPRHTMQARGRDHPNRRSQYDRGTPRALLEDQAFANENHLTNQHGQALVEYRGDAPPGATLYYVNHNAISNAARGLVYQHGNGQANYNFGHGQNYGFNHGANRGGNQNRGRGNGRRRNHNNNYRGNNY